MLYVNNYNPRKYYMNKQAAIKNGNEFVVVDDSIKYRVRGENQFFIDFYGRVNSEEIGKCQANGFDASEIVRLAAEWDEENFSEFFDNFEPIDEVEYNSQDDANEHPETACNCLKGQCGDGFDLCYFGNDDDDDYSQFRKGAEMAGIHPDDIEAVIQMLEKLRKENN